MVSSGVMQSATAIVLAVLKSKKVCADCERKGHQNIEPELRACDHFLNNDVNCNRLAVSGVTQDSESRNARDQRMLMEEKTGKENSN